MHDTAQLDPQGKTPSTISCSAAPRSPTNLIGFTDVGLAFRYRSNLANPNHSVPRTLGCSWPGLRRTSPLKKCRKSMSQEWRVESQHLNQDKRTTNPSKDWRRTAKARTQAHTRQHPGQEWQGKGRNLNPSTHTHTAHPRPGMVGYRQSVHTNTHTPRTLTRIGGLKTKTRTQTHAPQTPARSFGVHAERTHKHAHPKTPARNGGAQPKPKPKLTQPHRTPRLGMVHYRRSAETNTHTPTTHPGLER